MYSWLAIELPGDGTLAPMLPRCAREVRTSKQCRLLVSLVS